MSKEISELEKTLDWLFSRYIRQREVNEHGYVQCFICKDWHHWLSMTNGHFRKRRFLATRWHEVNCECLCAQCNGEDDVKLFAKLLDEKHGPGTAEMLTHISHKNTRFGKIELTEMIEKYDKTVFS